MKLTYSLAVICVAGMMALTCCSRPEPVQTPPNIIYILADDLGYGDLGCYGQEVVQTPNLDRLAEQGMLFTQHYAGSTVCAPSRSVLMTGRHTGHTAIRGNHSPVPGGRDMPSEIFTLAKLLKEAGYTTGIFGKWGLGARGTEGVPGNQGFDEFLGYLDQGRAHRYYPDYLIHNGQKFPLEGNDLVHTVTYAPDVIQEHTLEFIRENSDTTFFAYVPSIIPHAELIAPEDTFMRMYEGTLPEEAAWDTENEGGSIYAGNDYGAPDFRIAGYASQERPHQVFAAMVTRLDHYVGEIMDELEKQGIAGNTLIMFSSDNGPHLEGGADPGFFNSNGPLRGYKRDLYEGGIRVPMIVRWPGMIEPGSRSDHVSAFWDIMPTLAEIAGVPVPGIRDGISMLPALLGSDTQEKHNHLYWEFHEQNGKVAVRRGKWKAVRVNVFDTTRTATELYDLEADPGEENNLAGEHPEVIKQMERIMKAARKETEAYPFPVVW